MKIKTLLLPLPGAPSQVLKITLKPNMRCTIFYSNLGLGQSFYWINIWTNDNTQSNRINYCDGQTSAEGLDDGVNIWNTLSPSIAN